MSAVVGLDLSMSATGVAHTNGRLETWKPTGNDERLVEIAAHVIDLVTVNGPVDLVVVENFVIRTPNAGNAGMLHGITRLELLRRGVPYVLVPPATLKMFATGKGNATKPDMRMELFRRAGIDERDDNRVDAWWLRAMGLHALGVPAVELPKDHTRALDKVTWPTGEMVA